LATVFDDALSGALSGALSVKVLDPDPGAANEGGKKLAVIPAGSPLTDSATAELNPALGATLAVRVALEPGFTLSALIEVLN
jgi:hypothetical protein